MARPFLKWAGGKAKLAPLIVERAPRAFGRYIEPFVGGGAVFFRMQAEGLARPGAVLSDLNGALIGAYIVLRDDPAALGAELERLACGYEAGGIDGRAEFYYARRDERPATAVGRAARLIFLNRTCYNGLYRVNAAGEFNVPHGRYANPKVHDRETLAAASAALQGVELRCEGFADACARARRGDFVYLDPPYHPLSATAHFTAYTAPAFGMAEQEQLADVFEQLTRRGVAALLSNSDHPAIRALYSASRFSLETVAMSRAINSNTARRTSIGELLVGNLETAEVREALSEVAQAER